MIDFDIICPSCSMALNKKINFDRMIFTHNWGCEYNGSTFMVNENGLPFFYRLMNNKYNFLSDMGDDSSGPLVYVRHSTILNAMTLEELIRVKDYMPLSANPNNWMTEAKAHQDRLEKLINFY